MTGGDSRRTEAQDEAQDNTQVLTCYFQQQCCCCLFINFGRLPSSRRAMLVCRLLSGAAPDRSRIDRDEQDARAAAGLGRRRHEPQGGTIRVIGWALGHKQNTGRDLAVPRPLTCTQALCSTWRKGGRQTAHRALADAIRCEASTGREACDSFAAQRRHCVLDCVGDVDLTHPTQRAAEQEDLERGSAARAASTRDEEEAQQAGRVDRAPGARGMRSQGSSGSARRARDG